MINRSAVILPLVLLLLPAASLSQLTPGGPLSGLSTVDRQNREQERRNERDLERRLNTVRDLERVAQVQTARMRDLGYKDPKLDSDAKERVRESRKVNISDLNHYAAFLQLENTGIFKLFPNSDCLTNDLVRVDGDCANFVPMSSDFSFRQKSYIDSQYSDIQFIGDELKSTSFFAQGMFMSLGEIPIDNVSLESISEITKVAPANKIDAAVTMAADLLKGTNVEGRTLTSRIKPQVNLTYAFRIIAYRVSNSFPPISNRTTHIQLKFMSLSYDKRSDEVIVFKVVRKDDIGGLTIVWKRLQKQESPKIKFQNDEVLRDFH